MYTPIYIYIFRVDRVTGKVDLSLRLSQVDPEAAKLKRRQLGEKKRAEEKAEKKEKRGEKKAKRAQKQRLKLSSDGESARELT